MLSSSIYPILALFAGTARAQSTRTATVLIPDWCVTQSQPTVTVLGQGDLTTYSYSCSISSAAASSASARASRDAESAKSRASAARTRANDPQITGSPEDYNNNRRSLTSFYNFGKRDNDCFGWDAFEACIPWEITQGPSTWVVHYTASGIAALDQECSFGSGGVSSGAATCTASGRLDPSVWGGGSGIRTHTFAKTDVDKFWIRNTVAVTAGGPPMTTGTLSGSGVPTASGSPDTKGNAADTRLSIPMGTVALGSILTAALAL